MSDLAMGRIETSGRRAECLPASAAPDGRWSRTPRLTQAAERRLVSEAQAGHPEQVERLIELFQPSIGGIARRYRATPGVSHAELMQQGVVGLLRALGRYDPELGVPFWAYASWWVRQALQQLVAELSRPVVLSDRALRQLTRIKQVERDYGQRSHHQPSAATLASESGVTCSQIDRLRAADRAAAGFDEPVGGDGGGGTFAEQFADPDAEDLHGLAAYALAAQELPGLLATLTDRERVVVRARFGFDGCECTLVELGKRLSLSAERVRQVEQVALVKLRERSTQCG
jgi:RNA polymerase sigma factor (sigma-70 family)